VLIERRSLAKLPIFQACHARTKDPKLIEMASGSQSWCARSFCLRISAPYLPARQLLTIAQLAELDRLLAKMAYGQNQVRLLMTLPGFDYTVAQGLLAALGDLSRFPDGDHAAAFLGLAPSTRQSGNHCYHGPITKAGRSHARWLLTQAAQRLDQNPGPLGVFFRGLARRENRNVAVVAAARKLVTIAFLMLKHNEPYRYAMPTTTNAKLTRLRFQVTRTRRSFPNGRSAAGGDRSPRAKRAAPALADVYEKEELPPLIPLRQLPPGERRMLRRRGVTAVVHQIQRGQPPASTAPAARRFREK
jgi:hypothetical protein